MKKLNIILVIHCVLSLLLTGCDIASLKNNTPEPTAKETQSQGITQQPTAEATPTVTPAPTAPPVTATPEITAAPTATPTKTPAPTVKPTPTPKPAPTSTAQPKLTTEQLVQPFWKSSTMYNESICMIKRSDGSITGKLLFAPTNIISIYDNSLRKLYIEGKDYTWTKGSKTIKWLNGSAIKYFTQNDIEGRDENGNYIVQWGDTANGWTQSNPWDSLGRSRFGNQLYCVGSFLYEKQIAVTYTYNTNDWPGYNAVYQNDKLPKTTAKLNSGSPLRITIYGDSIFTGCDSSSLYGRLPKTPTFPKLVELALEKKYYNGSTTGVTVKNPSVGGMTSVWGKDNAYSLVANTSPDLVIIGFGMNSDLSMTGEVNAENIQSIIDTVKAKNPNCEFLVLTCMVPNAAAGFLTTQNQFSTAYAALAKTGVGFVDMYQTHYEILKSKDFIATSGNNINHPNDWLARVYAMNILSALIRY